MTESHAIAALIPFHTGGTLDDESRQQVEDHLEKCESCRDLSGHARAFHAAATGGNFPMDGRDHVQSQLLVEFQETPEALEAEVTEFIRAHLDGCELCAGALAILAELPAMVTLPDTEARPRDHPLPTPHTRSPWSEWVADLWLPLPALGVAALLLALLLPAYLMLRTAPGEGTASPTSIALISRPGEAVAMDTLPRAISVAGETLFRQSPGKDGPPAVELPLDDKNPFLLLDLSPDIDPEDLADPLARFHLLVLQENHVLFQRELSTDEFDRGGQLQVVLHAAQLSPGVAYALVIRYEKVGDPLHGEAMFRRIVRLQRSD